jgi:pimeloyl-ACP methyl ester carboxylesterase
VETTPYVRESGSGVSVICLHSAASSSGQWRALMSALSDTYHVVAMDLYGYGKSPDWTESRDVCLADEISLIEPVISQANHFHLVGHSYGAHVALRLALDNPGRVRSLTLYEPVAFYLLKPDEAARLEIETIRDETIRLIASGVDESAAECFLDYWIGPGAWAAVPQPARAGILKGMQKIKAEWKTGFEPTCLPEQIQTLSMPVLLLTGSQTTSSARGVMQVIRGLLPNAAYVELSGLGHMGPVTHPDAVNREIGNFIAAQDG